MLELDKLNEKLQQNNGRCSESSISELDEYEITNENDQNQFNFSANKVASFKNQFIDSRKKNEVLFTITNLDVDRQNDNAFLSNSPANISPSITIQSDEDDRSIGNISENDFVPELNVVEQPKKLSLLLPESSNHNKNRRMSTPAMSTPGNQQAIKKQRPKIPTLKIISSDLNALDLRSSVPLSPTSLCKRNGI